MDRNTESTPWMDLQVDTQCRLIWRYIDKEEEVLAKNIQTLPSSYQNWATLKLTFPCKLISIVDNLYKLYSCNIGD